MSKQEVIEHDTLTVAANNAALNSVRVMEQWGGGETYNEDRWIERGRQAMRQTVEGMFELGRVLICVERTHDLGKVRRRLRSFWDVGTSSTTAHASHPPFCYTANAEGSV